MSQHWAAMQEAGALSGMKIMVWIHARIGRPAFNVALVVVMAYFFIRQGGARRASIEFLRRVRLCYPDSLKARPILWLSYCHFFAFGQSLLDKYLAWAKTPPTIHMDPDDSERLYAALETGQGCLLVGSHFGNLEYSRGIAHRHPGLVINVLIYDQHAQKFAALIEESEPESRLHLIQVTDVDIELALDLKERVQRGEWVVIAGDRVPVGESNRICEATFLGKKARFPIGPYVLANLLRCPVHLLHCFKMNGQYQLGFEPFEERIQLPRKDRQGAYEKAAGKFAKALEQQVAGAPLQWFNFFDFWAGSENLASQPPSRSNP